MPNGFIGNSCGIYIEQTSVALSQAQEVRDQSAEVQNSMVKDIDALNSKTKNAFANSARAQSSSYGSTMTQRSSYDKVATQSSRYSTGAKAESSSYNSGEKANSLNYSGGEKANSLNYSGGEKGLSSSAGSGSKINFSLKSRDVREIKSNYGDDDLSSGSHITGRGNQSNIVIDKEEYDEVLRMLRSVDEATARSLYEASMKIEDFCSSIYIVPDTLPPYLSLLGKVKTSLSEYQALTEETSAFAVRFVNEILDMDQGY